MARHPDEDDAFVFDLADDEGGVDAPPDPPDTDGDGAPDEAGSTASVPPASGGSVGGRRMLVVAAVLAIALGTGLVVDSVGDAARIERIRGMSGGVVDVSSPLDEVWAWAGEVGSRRAFLAGDGHLVAALGDVLAFESDGELVALRAATGEEAWTVPLGEDPDCGPTGYRGWSEIATTVLVCLQGAGAGREVLTVGPDGEASVPRAFDARDVRRYGYPRPGPEGTVLRAKRIGPESAVDLGSAECPDMGECSGTVEAGRDLLLRAENAVSGEERWRATVPFRAMAAEGCKAGPRMPWDRSNDIVRAGERLDTEAFGARIEAGLVDVWGCGLRAGVTPDGAVLDGVPGSGWVVSLDTGGYAAQAGAEVFDGAMRSALFSPDGGVVSEVSGYLDRPETTDEPYAATLLAIDRSGPYLRSYEADGTQRWGVAVEVGWPMFIAQVDGTVVTTTWTGGIRGLDLATGDGRWAWDPEGLYDWSYDNTYVTQAFTDGQSLLLLLRSGSGGSGLVSLDVASGEVVWDGTASGVLTPWVDTMLLVAVDGNLLEVTRFGVRRLG